jgi:hypothetical protein
LVADAAAEPVGAEIVEDPAAAAGQRVVGVMALVAGDDVRKDRPLPAEGAGGRKPSAEMVNRLVGLFVPRVGGGEIFGDLVLEAGHSARRSSPSVGSIDGSRHGPLNEQSCQEKWARRARRCP